MEEEVIGEIHTSIYLYIIIYIPTTYHSRSQKHSTYKHTNVPIGGLYHIIVQFLGLGEFRIINILIVVVVVVMHGE